MHKDVVKFICKNSRINLKAKKTLARHLVAFKFVIATLLQTYYKQTADN